jgi:hypothetical protein
MKGGTMIRQSTTLMDFSGAASLAGYTAAVSLHAHTDWSKEGMHNVARYFDQIPIVSRFVRRELDDYSRRNNETLDFSRAWWHPPVDAESVFESETSQITKRLGLTPIVSITDHDTLEGNFELQRSHPHSTVPISCEWTVPFQEGFFHLGVHNLPQERAREIFAHLSSHTQDSRPGELSRLLESLNENPAILIVLNHPLWDLAGVGAARHVGLVRRFLTEHRDVIHALELNGYRSWRENNGVQALQREYPLPLISGGDRHGRAPNALLNLTTASDFGAFAREIRARHSSHILTMPEYRTSLVSRKLATASDAMVHHPGYAGRERWTDRIWHDEDGVARPLSTEWPDGGPFWVRASMTAFVAGTSRPLRPLMRLLIWGANASRSHDPGPASHVGLPQTAPAASTPRKPV